MTTRRQSRLEETQRMLSEESSSEDDAKRIIPENSEEEMQLLFANNDTERVALTTAEDNDIMIDEVNMALTAQLNTNKANSNGTEDINHGLYTMCMSDKVGIAIINGSDGSSSSSTLPQDVKMQSTTHIETTKTKVVISKTLKKKVKKIECPGLKAYLKSFKKR